MVRREKSLPRTVREWEIVADPRLASVGAQAWVMEWHDKRCPHADPSAAARAALREAGFEVLREHARSPRTEQSALRSQ
jgi:hypothetical protein